MLIASYNGFGASDFMTATGFDTDPFNAEDWKCVESACYGRSSAEEYAWALQAVVNRFASMARMKRINVDGWIGNATTTAVSRIASAVFDHFLPDEQEFGTTIAGTTLTPLAVAMNAGQIIATFNRIADDLGLPAMLMPTIPSGAKAAPRKPISDPVEGMSVWWYVLGAVVLASVGTAGYVIYKRRKGKEVSTERVRRPAFA